MTKPEILEKKSINMSVLKEDLAKIQKRDGELSFRGNKTDEYVKEFSILKTKDAEELFKKLEELNIPRLKDTHINKIIDIMPASMPELKLIMQGYALPVTNDNLKKMIDAVKKYLPEKKK
ncbi:MAG: hypothetical protein KJ685_01210 [Nanoarchaeota archaeon]|nr:hypothetical protein [Nanoarchaeota archaeon]